LFDRWQSVEISLASTTGWRTGSTRMPGGDLDLGGEGRGIGEDIERLEPGIAIEPGRRQQVVDHPDVDPVLLALLDGLADAPHVLGAGTAVGPCVGRDPRAELELRHADPPRR
jgi:hypothetical protein